MVVEKMILGIKHIQVMCQTCKGLCWTQPMSLLAKEIYRCHTCTEPKLLGVGRDVQTHLPSDAIQERET
jgi:hypothetical protein